jgi:hypothetical protein
LTCNALVYPWWGDANSVLNTAVGADGYAQPAETLGPQYEVNDPTGAYGYAYAAVLTSGSDSTCTGHVFNTRAAAEADTGFASVDKAASCIEAYNNTNYSRADAGGGMILLGANSAWSYGSTAYALGTMKTWLVVDKISTLTPSQVVIATGPTLDNRHVDSDGNTFLKFQNLTFNSSTAELFDGNTTGTDSFWLHNVNFTQNGTGAASAAFLWVPGAAYTTQSTFGTFTQGFVRYAGSYRTPWALIRGANCTNPQPSEVYTLVGNNNVVATDWIATGDATAATNDGAVVAFNSDYALTSTAIEPDVIVQATTPHGTAWVQNLFENIAANGVFWCASSVPALSCDNWIIQHTTLPCGTPSVATPTTPCSTGSPGINNRVGYGYTSNSSPSGLTRYNWSYKWNNNSWINSKTDDFPPYSALNVGNWSLDYGASSLGNCQQTLMDSSIEFYGLGWVEPCSTNYINDLAGSTGGGNYHLLSTSQAINVAPWTTVASDVIPYDLDGHPRVGRAVSGVYTFGTARRGWR